MELSPKGNRLFENQYSFTAWKVAISGFYKQLYFKCIGPFAGKPIVFDDTCYFFPCNNEHEARILTNLLNSEHAQGFYRSRVFWDQKRPVTAQLLANLDLNKLLSQSSLASNHPTIASLANP